MNITVDIQSILILLFLMLLLVIYQIAIHKHRQTIKEMKPLALKHADSHTFDAKIQEKINQGATVIQSNPLKSYVIGFISLLFGIFAGASFAKALITAIQSCKQVSSIYLALLVSNDIAMLATLVSFGLMCVLIHKKYIYNKCGYIDSPTKSYIHSTVLLHKVTDKHHHLLNKRIGFTSIALIVSMFMLPNWLFIFQSGSFENANNEIHIQQCIET